MDNSQIGHVSRLAGLQNGSARSKKLSQTILHSICNLTMPCWQLRVLKCLLQERWTTLTYTSWPHSLKWRIVTLERWARIKVKIALNVKFNSESIGINYMYVNVNYDRATHSKLTCIEKILSQKTPNCQGGKSRFMFGTQGVDHEPAPILCGRVCKNTKKLKLSILSS